MLAADVVPDAVLASCLSFLSSRRHSACARVSARFRRLAMMPVGFPETVRVRNTRRLWRDATPALERMRPTRLLHIVMSPDDAEDGAGDDDDGKSDCLPATLGPAKQPFGRLDRLLRGQSRLRHLRLSAAPRVDGVLESRVHLLEELQPMPSVATSSNNGDDDKSDDDRRASEAALGAKQPNGRSSPADGDPRVLAACQRLDLWLTLRWDGPGVDELLRRVPNVTQLDCVAFYQPHYTLLAARLPRLESLRIAAADGKRIPGFAGKLLETLPALRMLSLPDAITFYDELEIAADRLETLEVKRLMFDENRRDKKAPMTPRLKLLIAHIDCQWARYILARAPALRAGRLTLLSLGTGAVASCAHLVAIRDSAAASHIHWTYFASQASHRSARDLQHKVLFTSLGGVVAKLRGVVSHRVDASVPPDMRKAIAAADLRVKNATKTAATPSPKKADPCAAGPGGQRASEAALGAKQPHGRCGPTGDGGEVGPSTTVARDSCGS
jgi:hypothetical protein